MTYDPYSRIGTIRIATTARDLDDYSGGVAILVGALLLAALGGFIYFAGPSDRSIRQIRPPITQPSTTGAAPAPERSSANMPPATPPKVNSVE